MTHGLRARKRIERSAKQLPAVDEGLHDEVGHCERVKGKMR